LYNSPREPWLPTGSFDRGNGFLQDRGFTVAMLQWELGQGIELPQFAGAPSVSERYANPGSYADRIRAAASTLVVQRFLLEDDAREIERAARSVSTW